MTTQHRRTPQERARDILQRDLEQLRARASKSKAVWERDEAEVERVGKVVAMLRAETTSLPWATTSPAALAPVLQPPMPCQWDEIPHAHRELRDGTLECVEEKP